MEMNSEEVLRIINTEIERIKSILPEKGRRLEIIEYHLPKDLYNKLMENEEFKELALQGKANLGGIPIIPSSEFKIVYRQMEKQRKYFRKKERKKKKLEKMEP